MIGVGFASWVIEMKSENETENVSWMIVSWVIAMKNESEMEKVSCFVSWVIEMKSESEMENVSCFVSWMRNVRGIVVAWFSLVEAIVVAVELSMYS